MAARIRLSSTTPFSIEHELWADRKGPSPICGIDEAGRGPLAGPVVICALTLEAEPPAGLIKDSKLLSPQQRQKAEQWLQKNASYAIVTIPTSLIENKNIYRATHDGMCRAWATLMLTSTSAKHVTTIVTDALPLTLAQSLRPPHLTSVMAPTHGEFHSLSVAAASILAKEFRDRLMRRYEELFPAHALGTHKGYGTARHRTSLITAGPTLIHRHSFTATFLKTKLSPRTDSSYTTPEIE